MRAASKVTFRTHQVLRLPRNSEFKISARNPWIASAAKKKPIRRHSEHDPSAIQAWSDHDIVISHSPLRRPCSSDLGDVFVLKNTTCRAPAISQNVTKCRACHKSHIPTSPNTVPATQNEWHAWSSSHMKHHFQCAQQQKSPSNFTKCCACQAKWISWVIRGHMNHYFQCAEQVKSPFKLTKYCACHEILSSTFQLEILELLRQ